MREKLPSSFIKTLTGKRVLFLVLSIPIFFAAISLINVFFAGISNTMINKGRTEKIASQASEQKQPSAVLGAEDTQKGLTGEIDFNIPAIFNDQVTINANTLINGAIKMSGQDIDTGGGKVFASNLVYGLTAGQNVTISGDPQNPVISAIVPQPAAPVIPPSVTSFQGQQGALTLSAGSGISIDGLKVTNTDPGSAQKIFGTINANGTTFTAGSNNDALSFTAGSGITITPDAGTKNITIAATGGGGGSSQWTTTGSDIYYLAGNVGIGTNTPGKSLDIAGTARISGAVTLSGLTTGILHSDGAGNLSSTAVNLASEVSGTLGILNGGTGAIDASTARTNLGAAASGANADITSLSGLTTALSTGQGGTGVNGAAATNGQILIGNGSGYTLATISQGSGITITNGSGTVSIDNTGVTSITGTANQISASGGTGAVTLSLPQDIDTTSSPTFNALTLTNGSLIFGSGNTGTATTDVLSAPRTYTFPDSSGEVCLTSGNCSGSGGGITGSGTTNRIAKFTSASGISDSSIYDNGKVGIGTISPTGLFDVSGGPAGQALTVFNYTGSGENIIAASASGSTKFTLDASGNVNTVSGVYKIGGATVLSSNTLGSGITASSLTSVGTITSGTWNGTAIDLAHGGTGGNDAASARTNLSAAKSGANADITALSGLTTALSTGQGGTGANLSTAAQGSVPYFSATGIMSALGPGTSGYVLTTNGAGQNPSWTPSAGLGTNYWQYNNGVLSSKNVTDDLAVGNIASGSAYFLISGTTGDASSAGNLTFKGTTTKIQQLNGGALTFQTSAGGSAGLTDRFVIGNNGSITIGSLGTGLVHSNASGVLSSSAVALGGADVSGQLGLGNGGTGGTDAASARGNLSAAKSGANSDITSLSGLTTALSVGQGGTGLNGSTAANGTILIGNGSGYTLATLTQGTGINISNGAGSISISNSGVTSLTGTVNQIGVSGNTGTVTLSLPQDIDSTASPTFDSLNLTAAGNQLTLGNGNTGVLGTDALTTGRTYTLPDASGTICLVQAGNCAGSGTGITGSGTTNRLAKFTAGQGLGNGSINDLFSGVAVTIDANGNLGVNATSPLAALDVRGRSGTTPGASISAQTASSSLIVDQSGVGNILAASKSGATKFVVTNTGNLQFSGNTNFLSTITSAATSNQTYTLPDATGTICLTSGNCAGAGSGLTGSGTAGQLAFFSGGTQNLSSDPAVFFDSTNKYLGLGTSSPVARLDVRGATGTTPAASISATSSFASLISDNAGSGDLFTASKSGATKFTINNTGNVQINNLGTGVVQSGSTGILSSSSLNLAGGSSFITGTLPVGNGGTGQISFTSNGVLYGNASGGLQVTAAGTDGQILIGRSSSTPIFAALSSDATISNTGALTLKNTGTAGTYGSASQVPVLTTDAQGRVTGVTNTGIAIAASQITSGTLSSTNGGTGANLSSAAQGAIPYFSATGVMSALAPGSSGYVLTTNGAGQNPTWTPASGLGTNYFQRSSGTIAPLTITDDFLLGGTSTASARFAFINNASGTPTASISGTTANAAFYLDGNGNLGTTNKQTLTLGSSSTGNIALNGFSTGLIHSNASGVLSATSITNSDLSSGSYANITGVGTLGSLSVTGNISTGTVNKVTITAPATGSTLTIADGKTLTVNNTLTLAAGADGQTYTFPAAGGTVCTTASCLTANQTITLSGDVTGSGTTAISTTIANSAVTLAKMANLAANSIIGNNTGSAATPVALSTAQVKTMLSLNNVENTALSTWAGSTNLTTLGTITSGTWNGTAIGTQYGGTGQNWSAVATGALPYFTSAGTMGTLAIGGSGQVLSVSGGVPAWISTSSINFWQRANGAVAPLNITDDLLLGGIGTSSAKFAFLNNAGGTPTASISGSTTNAATYIDGNGNLGTTNKQTLTLGSSSTGNIVLNGFGAGVIHSNASGVLSSTSISNSDLSSGSYANITGVGTLGSLSVTGNTSTGTVNKVTITTPATGSTLTIADGKTFAVNNTLTLAAGADGQTFTFPAAGGTICTTTTCSVGTNYWQASGSVIAPSTTTNLVTIGAAPTINAATLDVRGLSGTLPVASLSGVTAKAALLVDNSGVGDLFTASKSGATKFVITNAGTIGVNGVTTPLDTLDVNGTIRATTQLNFTGAAAGQIQNVTAGGFLDFKTAAGVGGITFDPNATETLRLTSTGLIAAGASTNNPLATLDLRARSGTLSIASVSGATSNAGLIVDNSGSGDILTASSSGKTRFTIQQSGTVVIGDSTNGITFDYTGAQGGGMIYNGNARTTKTITLSPEYAGAILTASGSATTNGLLTSDASPSANFRTYYQWTSSQTTLQDYTVAVRVTLPKDFAAWTSSSALSLDLYTNLNGTGSNKVDITIYNPTFSSSIPVLYDQSQVSPSNKSWATRSYGAPSLSNWATAGQTATFYIKMYSKDSNDVMIGDIVLNYLSKF